uniref:bolA-like protein 3 n=1 Tax=Ciona intestinalis TaxID=7719 RepID=UPI0002B8ECAE|nr:bolA-like protein 3 [Ciona intestinalis]|eukprot:XP_009858982.1 bolA-like protein 3 [Ciona intestinalis]
MITGIFVRSLFGDSKPLIPVLRQKYSCGTISFNNRLTIKPHTATKSSNLFINNSAKTRIRWFTADASPTNGEAKIEGILKVAFPNSESIQVKDISGGCGDMYEVHIVSSDFKGKRVVQQHKLVNEALKTEVQKMHGLRIFTSVPS